MKRHQYKKHQKSEQKSEQEFHLLGIGTLDESSSSQAWRELLSLGTKADDLCFQGDFDASRAAYHNLLSRVESTGLVDSFVSAKITLGMLLLNIKTGQQKKAFEIWNAHLEDSIFGLGIYGLENANAPINDLILFDFLCAYLHSLAAQSPTKAGHAINIYMTRICEQAIEEQNRFLLRMAISNWKRHLQEVFPNRIPQQYAVDLIDVERYLGQTVVRQPLDFPKPSPWMQATISESARPDSSTRINSPGTPFMSGTAARKLK